ncbi:MAG: PKD domain-containing protein [Thermoplasmatales archaeon]|nr:MAG: PKD domain-containing protein [Thermoplasmatales archaeon]
MIVILITIFLTILAVNPISKSESPTIVKGYVYVNGTITKPDEVHLTFPDQSRIATLYDDGRYLIIFDNEEPGTNGSFYIIYSGKSYEPEETITLEAGVYVYDIDLHIEVSTSTTGGGSKTKSTKIRVPPVANASGPYMEIVGVPVEFDGSKSYDTGGKIVKYLWSFGDGTIGDGKYEAHTYTEVGNYTVILKVVDDDSDDDIETTWVVILPEPNLPPNKPTLEGPKQGRTNTSHNYTVITTDPDNDTVKFAFDWGDGTEITFTDFVLHNTSHIESHSWNSSGIYTIKVYAIDDRNVSSGTEELEVLMGLHYCWYFGYLIDENNDGIYDTLHSNITGNDTSLGYQNGHYLIDINENGEWDYRYNSSSETLGIYYAEEENKNILALFDIEISDELLLLISIISLSILVAITEILIFFYVMRKKKTPQTKTIKSKKKSKKKKPKIKDNKLEDIELFIDEKLKDDKKKGK